MPFLNLNIARILIAVLALVVIPLQAKGAVLCFEHDGQVNFEYAYGNGGCNSCPDEQQPKSSFDSFSRSDLCCVDVPLVTQSLTINKSPSQLDNLFLVDNVVAIITNTILDSPTIDLSSPFPDTPNNVLQNVDLLRSTILLI